MNRTPLASARTIFTVIAILAIVASSLRAAPKTAEIKGYVLDSACAFTKDLSKPISRDCAIACAKKGSPMAILADDGTLYLPISGQTPSEGQNARLMQFAGQKVIVHGMVYDKGGSHAIVIDKIEAAPAK